MIGAGVARVESKLGADCLLGIVHTRQMSGLTMSKQTKKFCKGYYGPAFRRVDMGVKGFGLIAAKPFTKGDLITPIASKDVYNLDIEDMVKRATAGDEDAMTLSTVSKEYAYGDGSKGNTWMPKDITVAGWWTINHSCNPNSLLSGKGGVRALKNIQEGEEITCTYGWVKNKKMPCYCGAEFCAGIICPYFEETKFEGRPGAGITLNRESIKLIVETAHKYSYPGVVIVIPSQCKLVFEMDTKKCWNIILTECDLSLDTIGWLYSNSTAVQALMEIPLNKTPKFDAFPIL